VREQLRVAMGKRIDVAQADISFHGHAIEVRLYAEDPANGYLPSIGRLDAFAMPEPAVRFDTGYAAGCAVSPYYDPMLAKAIVHATSRAEAAAVLARGLRAMDAHGLVTNRDLLVAILDSAAFGAGETGTDFLDVHPGLLRAGPDDTATRAHVLAAALAGSAMRRASAVVQAFAPSGWRNVPALPQQAAFAGRAGDVEVTYALGADGSFTGTVAGRPVGGRLLDAQVRPDGSEVSLDLEVEGVRRRLRCCAHGDPDTPRWEVADGWWATTWRERSRFPDASADAGAHGPSTPVPGTVTVVLVAVGEAVEAGQTLVVLEAMKMEHRINADVDGVVAELHVAVGQSVDAHHVVAVLE
jgi:propionyl-CoA carboxylase alpha chain